MWVVGLHFTVILRGVVWASGRMTINRLRQGLHGIRWVKIVELTVGGVGQFKIFLKDRSTYCNKTYSVELFVQTMYSISSLYGFKNV